MLEKQAFQTFFCVFQMCTIQKTHKCALIKLSRGQLLKKYKGSQISNITTFARLNSQNNKNPKPVRIVSTPVPTVNDTAGSGASSGMGNFINIWREKTMNKRQIKKTDKSNMKKVVAVKKDVNNFMKNTEENAMNESKEINNNTNLATEKVEDVIESVTKEVVDSNIILDKGDRCIRSIIERNGATGEIKDIKFALSENGKTYLGLEKLIGIPIEAIMDSAAKFDCLMDLKRYDYSITDEELKKAWENLQQLVRYRKFIVETNELAVTDVLDMVIEYAEFMIRESKQMSSEEQKEFEDKYRRTEDEIMISTKIMDDVLKEVGAEGYTKTTFCKKVRELEQFEQKKILVGNRSGNRGYDYNTTGNKAFYKIVRNWRSGNGQK